MTDASPFGDRAFSVQAGMDDGLSRGILDSTRFTRPFHGVRQSATVEVPEGSLKRLAFECAQFTPRMREGWFFSHSTGLALYGAPTPRNWVSELHVSAYRPDSAPRTKGIVGHRLRTRDSKARRRLGLAVESPARAWVQTSYLWETDDLIAAADFLVARRRGLATLDELAAEARRVRGGVLDDVLAQVREGSESPEETRLRLTLVRAGLPEPQLNINLHTDAGDFVARVDQAYPAFRVAVEYDGRQHAMDAAQFATRRGSLGRDPGSGLGARADPRAPHGRRRRARGRKVRTALLRQGWSDSA